MLFRETVAVYCENHTEHTDTLCGLNVEFQHFRACGRYSNHWAVKDSLSRVLSLNHGVYVRIYIYIYICTTRFKIENPLLLLTERIYVLRVVS
jgi:hypothetical protein